MAFTRLNMTAVCALSFSLVSVSAKAQFAPPPPLQLQFRVDEARAVLADFAKCNVKKNPDLAREFILSNRNYSLDDKFRMRR